MGTNSCTGLCGRILFESTHVAVIQAAAVVLMLMNTSLNVPRQAAVRSIMHFCHDVPVAKCGWRACDGF